MTKLSGNMKTKKTTYFKGDKAEYTGKTEELYGGLFYEIKLLEGHLKDHLRLINRSTKL